MKMEIFNLYVYESEVPHVEKTLFTTKFFANDVTIEVEGYECTPESYTIRQVGAKMYLIESDQSAKNEALNVDFDCTSVGLRDLHLLTNLSHRRLRIERDRH